MNTNTATIPYIDTIIQWSNQLLGLPSAALTVLLCLAFGWLLKSIKRFPNDAIPVAVVLFGIAFFMLVAPYEGTPMRIIVARNFGVGLLLGSASWALHRFVLKRWLPNPDDPPEPPADQNTPKT